MAYPGEVKYVECPVCGTKVKLVCKTLGQFEGTCPGCGKKILE